MAWDEAYLCTKWHLDPSSRLAARAENWRVVPPFWGRELGPHLTECRLCRGLPPTKWHLDPFSHLATTGMGGKLGGGCAPFGEAELGPHLTQCGQGRGLPEAKFHLDPSNRWPRYTNVTDSTDNNPIP